LNKKLEQLRQEIDQIDDQLLKLFNQRATLAQQTATIKKSEANFKSLYRSDREALILRAIKERNQGPLEDRDIVFLFRELMSQCLRLEQPLQIGYLGPKGTFTQEASLKHFGQSVKLTPLTLIDDVFQELQNGFIDYGVVPIENSSEGVVHSTLDALLRNDVKINSEIELKIHQNILISQHTVPEKISQIYSHSMSFAQCRVWLDRHFPNVKKIAVTSNAEAANKVRSEWHSAAIASKMAAKLYQLDVLYQHIEDKSDNCTRFLVLGNQSTLSTGKDKTSIIITAHNESGILFDILRPFKEHNVSLSRIETRPTKEKLWSYAFFIDFIGHEDDANTREVFQKLQQLNIKIKYLGSYPQAL